MKPSLSVIIPIQDGENSQTVKRINLAFFLAKNYEGFTEIIAVLDGTNEKTFKIARMTIKLNKINCPQIRTTVMLHASCQGLIETIKTGISRTLGEKTVILLNPIKVNEVEKQKIMELDSDYEIIE